LKCRDIRVRRALTKISAQFLTLFGQLNTARKFGSHVCDTRSCSGRNALFALSSGNCKTRSYRRSFGAERNGQADTHVAEPSVELYVFGLNMGDCEQ